MYYEINIAKLSEKDNKYYHYFATAERSIVTERQLKELYSELKKAFPEPQYNISVQRIETIGYGIDVNTLN